ncbi:MAG: aminotransferase class I/II-fold pyridoxal phosphate-dependent enzyme [Candidatus Saccharibacteria bacterium]
MNITDLNAPLYKALISYRQENNALLHMPGHKGGRGLPLPEYQAVGAIDHTEVPGLDDLHLPQGVIGEAQILAARAWGAGESLFLVNGATSGIQALLMGFDESDKILVPRNAHRSFLGGLILCGASPVYLDCVIDPDINAAVVVTPSEVMDKLVQHPDAAGLCLVSPTFYGTVNDVRSIADLALARDIPLIVDEAHGGHFAFHSNYPQPALDCGAAACVHGLHKTLPVLTQAGIMHLASGFKRGPRVKAAYDVLTTTSPSFPLMASIDVGRALMEKDGQSLLNSAKEIGKKCRASINKISGLRCRTQEFTSYEGIIDYDPLKVLVEIVDLNLSGYRLAEDLRQRCAIQVEMAGDNYVLAMFSPFNDPKDWELLVSGLRQCTAGVGRNSGSVNVSVMPPIPEQALTPRQAFMAGKISVNIEESAGYIAAEMVAGYPPGIPCLMPGEVITEQIRDYILELRAKKIPLHGLSDLEYLHIYIVDM